MVKPKLLVLLGALVSIALAGAPKAAVDSSAAVYNLWVNHEGGLGVICTATAVDTSEGIIFLTAGHCVSDFNYRTRYFVSQVQDPDILIRVRLHTWSFDGIERWKNGDWAILKPPEGWSGPALPMCEPPEPGEDVYAWTGPLGMTPILRTGVYSGVINFPDDPDIQDAIGGMHLADIEGAPGSSGSSMLRVVDGRACVWGVWVGKFTQLDGAIISHYPGYLMKR